MQWNTRLHALVGALNGGLNAMNTPRLVAGGVTLAVGLCALAIGTDPSLRWMAALAGAMLAAGVSAWIETTQQLIWAAEEARAAGGDAAAAYRGWTGPLLMAAGGLMLAGLVGVMVLAGVRVRRAYTPISPLRSQVFEAERGCPVSAKGLKKIPAPCVDIRYQVRAAASAFGLPYPTGGIYWLRVGPDAAFVRWCNEDICKIGRVQQGVFPTTSVVRE